MNKIIGVFLLLLVSVSSYCDDIKKEESKANSLYVKGIEEFRNQSFEKALYYFNQVSLINISTDRKEPYLSSNSVHWEAAALYNMGNSILANELISDYMLSPVDQRSTIVSDSLWYLSDIAYEKGDLDSAISFALNAIANEKNVLGNEHYYVANSYASLSKIYWEKGEPEKAIKMIADAIDIYYTYGTPPTDNCVETLILYNCYSNDSDCVVSFSDYMQEKIALIQTSKTRKQEYYWAQECWAKGLYFLSENAQFPRNINILEHAIELYEEIPYHEQIDCYRSSLNKLALLYEHVYLEKAIEICQKQLSIERKYNVGDTLVTISNLAGFYKDIDYEKALQYAKTVLSVRESMPSPDLDKIRLAHFRLATIYSRGRLFEEAINHSKKALELAKTIYGVSSEKYATSLQNLAVYYLLEGDTIRSLEYTKSAYYNKYSDRGSISNNLAGVYSAINLPDSCFKYGIEAWKIACSDYIHNLTNLTKENRLSYICRPINYGQVVQPIFYMLSHEEHKDLRVLAFNSALFSKDIIKKCMSLNEGDTIASDYFESVRSYLNEGEIAIEIWENKEDVYYDEGDLLAFIIRSDYDTPKIVELSKDKVLRTFRNEYPMTETSLPMYDNIWKDIVEEAQIQAGEKIYLSLDGYLENVPVELIMGYDWIYVGDKYDIIRVSCTNEILNIKNSKVLKNAVLYGGLKYDSNVDLITAESLKFYKGTRSVYENYFEGMSDSVYSDLRSTTKYLPWTKMEVDTISYYLKKTLNNDVIVYEGDYGIEESFKDLSGHSPSILHIATHGFIGQSNKIPNSMWEIYEYFMENTSLLFSGVLNTADINKDILLVEDGILRSSEISTLDLSNTKLLVLSACSTGLGGSTPIGSVGLIRAFKAAGVGSILMTLDSVDDSACFYMMKFFYGFITAGYSERDSFKMAQKKLRDSEEYHDFSYWGNFVMID